MNLFYLTKNMHVPIEHTENIHLKNPGYDNTVVTRKSKRQRPKKSFVDDYILYLIDQTPRTI